MKNNSIITIVLAATVAGVLVTSMAMAGIGNISNTKHNFSAGGGVSGGGSNVFSAPGETQVCVFCHTPHNAGQSKMLWNKAFNAPLATYAAAFRLYTSSRSLSSVTRGSVLTVDSPSLLCLGCHDGKTAMNILHSSRSGVDAAGAGAIGYPAGSMLIPTSNSGSNPLVMPDPFPDPFTGLAGVAMNLGGSATGNDLTDDHPIGFSYPAVFADKLGVGFYNNVGMDSRIRFYGPNKNVECTTCHDPHVDSSTYPDLKPFLVKSNVGSGLCLTCHNK